MSAAIDNINRIDQRRNLAANTIAAVVAGGATPSEDTVQEWRDLTAELDAALNAYEKAAGL